MKKLVLFVVAIMMAGCIESNVENPLDYRGAVVTGNSAFLGDYRLQLRLTENQRDSFNYRNDHLWILVTEFDYTRYSLGDTIK